MIEGHSPRHLKEASLMVEFVPEFVPRPGSGSAVGVTHSLVTVLSRRDPGAQSDGHKVQANALSWWFPRWASVS